MSDSDKLDSRWLIAGGCTTKEDYLKKFVVAGHFHSGVPAEVIESYRIAEHLMAAACHHWEIYDEALRKLLGIFEMAIKKRCEELGIKMGQLDKKGKWRAHTLSNLIDLLCKAEPQKKLKDKLDHLRGLRNHFSHPDSHSFAGGMWRSKIIDLVNTLNSLFLPASDIEQYENEKAIYLAQFQDFEKGCFLLEQNQLRYMCTSAQPLEAFKIKDEWFSLWKLEMVIEDIADLIRQHKYPPPYLITLKCAQIKDGNLEAIDTDTLETVRLAKASEAAQIEKFALHQSEWEQIPLREREIMFSFQAHEVYNHKVEFEYELRWR